MHIDLTSLLDRSAERHSHLCPRQVLGARIGLAGAAALGLEVPRRDKRLLVILETDGCFADGIEVATGCTVGHRTMRIEDYGKVAATFVDVETEQSLRIAPLSDVRQKAFVYAPGESRHYFAQLQAYQSMPEAELLKIQPVHLNSSIKHILSRPGVRVHCEDCGEEIINQREIVIHGRVLCQSCVPGGYFHTAQEFPIAYSTYQELMK